MHNQVLYSLNDYLSNLELTDLSNQVYMGRISFSFYVKDCLTIKTSGYTQHLVQPVNTLLDCRLAIATTVPQLLQTKTWYR
ncbi:MAG: hypothetical protein ACTXOO_04575 [Sodalis sp. (in: enterobacteria)]